MRAGPSATSIDLSAWLFGVNNRLLPTLSQYPVPRRILPKCLVWRLAPLGGITRKHVVRNVDFPWGADNRKSRVVLGLKCRPLQESIQDMFQPMIDSDEIPEAGNAPAGIANPVAWNRDANVR